MYPFAKGLGLSPLSSLEDTHPEVAALLDSGHWTQAAEEKLRTLYA